MSLVTKVFVVLLTVFSIAFSMATISFVARQEEWKKVANEWRATALSASAETKVISAQMKLSLDQNLAKFHQLKGQNADLMRQNSEQNARVDELTAQGAQLQNQVSSLTGSLKSVEQTLRVAQTQLVSEQDFARQLAKRNAELERRNIDLNDRTKELTISLAMAHQQNKAYLEQISQLEGRGTQITQGPAIQVPDAAASVQANIPSVMATDMPSVSPIRGRITELKGDLTSVSVGSADGVQRGMTFMVFRGKEAGGAPLYVATVEITRVEANQSAGRIVRLNSPVQVGDMIRDDASFARRG